jgi:hypothetical protein
LSQRNAFGSFPDIPEKLAPALYIHNDQTPLLQERETGLTRAMYSPHGRLPEGALRSP